MDSLAFIRMQWGRMSDAQIMRNLGLRDSAYRELRALALVDADVKRPPDAMRGADRVISQRRLGVVRPDGEAALAMLIGLAQCRREQILTPQGEEQTALRDLLVWLLKSLCGYSAGRIGRALSMSEYGAGLSFRRYDEAIARGIEQRRHGKWRKQMCARLASDARSSAQP